MICQYCQKECKNQNSHRNHERTCPKNEKRIYKNGMKGKTPWNKDLDKSDERVAKNGKAISKSISGKKRRPWTQERKYAKSVWRKQYHLDNPEAHPNRKLAGNRSKISYPEQVAYDWLSKNNIKFEHQKKVGSYYPDFVIGNIIVEIDGEYWHDEEKDKKRDSFLQQNGYKVVRISTKEHIETRLSQILDVEQVIEEFIRKQDVV